MSNNLDNLFKKCLILSILSVIKVKWQFVFESWEVTIVCCQLWQIRTHPKSRPASGKIWLQGLGPRNTRSLQLTKAEKEVARWK